MCANDIHPCQRFAYLIVNAAPCDILVSRTRVWQPVFLKIPMGRIMSDDFRILVAVDLKTGTDQLLTEVRRYGRAFNAIVDVIHVAPPDPDFVGYLKIDQVDKPTQEDLIRDEVAKGLRTQHDQVLAIGANLQAGGVRLRQALAVQGPILGTILDHARKLDSNLLMLGSHHHSALYRLWYGDMAADAAKQPHCALLVVPVQTTCEAGSSGQPSP